MASPLPGVQLSLGVSAMSAEAIETIGRSSMMVKFATVIQPAFGVEVSLLGAIFVMAFSTLSTLIPSSPGYFGTFHIVAITALEIIGISIFL